jgi:hypothetical protein
LYRITIQHLTAGHHRSGDDDVVVVVVVAVWRIEPNKTFNGERRTYTGIWLFDWLHGQFSTKEVPILALYYGY